MRRTVMGSLILSALLGAATLAAAATKEVVIVTSFPKELFETYKKAFEARQPGVKVAIKPMQTNAGVTYVRETRAKPEADLFWASAVDAFAALEAEGLLEKTALPKEIAARIPPAIGAFPIHDPDGHYFGFAISGYGFMWNTPYLQAHKLSPPREWTDMADPRYFGHLAISAPSRSGTTHLTIEVILQGHGWDKGWALLLNAGGNMGTITERSFGVPEAVISGQYGIGIVVDFFGLSAIASGNPVDFAYPSKTAVVPANIGLLKGGPNAENARAFIHYLLSEEGQLVLFRPEVGRLPVIPELYAKGPKGYPNPFATKLGGVTFNDQLSSSRRNVVNGLFDQIITFRHAELKAAWGAIYRAEEAIAKAKGTPKEAAASGLVQEARALASKVPLDEKRAGDKAVNEAFKGKGELKSRLEAEWDITAKANYAKARGLAEKALLAAR